MQMDIHRAVAKLFHWQYNRTNGFGDMLFDLFMKANRNDYFALQNAFPHEAAALNAWKNNSPEELFMKYIPEIWKEHIEKDKS